MKLYELSQQYVNLLQQEIDFETFSDTLEGLDGEIEEKIDNIACFIKSLLAEAEAIEQEAKNLENRAKLKLKKADQLKEYLHNQLTIMEKQKIETTRNVISIKKNPVSLFVSDDFCNKYYMVEKVVETIDKTKLKEDLKNGYFVQGAELIQKTRLEIK